MDFSDLLIVRGLQAGAVKQEGLGGRSSKAKTQGRKTTTQLGRCGCVLVKMNPYSGLIRGNKEAGE